ncbi:MAG TPA: hypothetical protein VMW82_00270 [Candidatus Paceibacterota bacterium]|nr:hypothetical protein [Candidatus Paceibacterota bacterium]
MTIEKLESLEQKEEVPEWDSLIDKWIEDKVQKQMDRFKISDRKEAEEIVRDKFKKVFPRVFDKFAVHGIRSRDGKIKQYTDLDGNVCLKLLELAGFEIKTKGADANVSFIDFNQRLEGVVHMDVGQYDGVALLENTEQGLNKLELSDENALKEKTKEGLKSPFSELGMIIDHHPEGAPSTAGMVYKIINKLGLFKDNKQVEEIGQNGLKKIRKMVQFIDIIDSKGYQETGKAENWDKSDRTVLGLHRFMNGDTLLKFFMEDGDYNRPLLDSQLERYGLIREIERNGRKEIVNRQKEQREIIDISNQRIKELRSAGYEIDTKIGKMIIDPDNRIPGGAAATQSVGAGYLKWVPQNRTFFMFSPAVLDKSFSEIGTVTRKHLCLLPQGQKNSKLKLKTIINKIGGIVSPGSGLEHYLKTRD